MAEIFQRFKAAKAHPRIELDYSNPYTLLVAVILSAQATDISVNKVTKSLFLEIDTPEKMVVLGQEQLKGFIKSIGLFNSKAAHIISMSNLLITKFNSNVPDNLEDLTALPGVGRKSANVMMNAVFGKSTIAVDTHVFRVANRIGLCSTRNPLQTELALLERIPKEFQTHAHNWLVLHGRYICKAKRPACDSCIIYDLCKYEKKSWHLCC